MLCQKKKEIQDELTLFGYEGDDYIIEKLYTLAVHYDMDAREISDEWIAHIYSKTTNTQDSKENIEIFTDKLKDIVASKNIISKENHTLPIPTLNLNLSSLQEGSSQFLNNSNVSYVSDDEELMSIYGITPLQPKKRHTNTNIFSLDDISNMSILSPAMMTKTNESLISPIGSVETIYDGSYQLITPNSTRISISWDENSLTTINYGKHCYMNQTLKSKALLINRNIIEISDLIKLGNCLKFEFYHPIFLPSYLNKHHDSDDTSTNSTTSNNVYIRGRICSQSSNGKLSYTHCFMEGCIDISKGKRVQLIFSKIQTTYSIFPGQVVIVYGHHDLYEKSIFYVENIFYTTIIPTVGRTISNKLDFESQHLNLSVFGGPFIVIDSNHNNNSISNFVNFDYLQQIFSLIQSNNIQCVILVGPFITVQNDQDTKSHDDNICILSQLYSQLFEFFNTMVKKLDHFKLILVPSTQDLHTTHIYPLLPLYPNDFDKTIDDKIVFASCPVTIELNGLSICVTSVDILHHLSSFELSNIQSTNQLSNSCDRISRLIQHCFHQQTLYPLYPPYQKINLDLAFNKIYGRPYCGGTNQILPHILILPSKLKHFLKNIDGCLIVNPGNFVKGQTLGTFARFSLVSKLSDTRVTIDEQQSIAEIIKL